MFFRKYTPSVKSNTLLKEKVVSELNAFIYRLERGRIASGVDSDVILRICEEIKADTESLNNAVGTGEENIEAPVNRILALLREFKKISAQESVHRIQEVADELDFNLNLLKDILDGKAFLTPEEIKVEKASFARRRLNARLAELNEIRESLTEHSLRIEKEISGYEKDRTELDALILNESNERKINELYKKISAIKAKIDSLTVRKSNYTACFNLLDIIYVNAAEIVEATDYASDEISKAKALLNTGKLKRIIFEPEKAISLLKRIQKDINAIYERVQAIDGKVSDFNTPGPLVSEEALAYKAELERKKKGSVDVINNNGTETVAGEDI